MLALENSVATRLGFSGDSQPGICIPGLKMPSLRDSKIGIDHDSEFGTGHDSEFGINLNLRIASQPWKMSSQRDASIHRMFSGDFATVKRFF
jgi:hypothetical protein